MTYNVFGGTLNPTLLLALRSLLTPMYSSKEMWASCCLPGKDSCSCRARQLSCFISHPVVLSGCYDVMLRLYDELQLLRQQLTRHSVSQSVECCSTLSSILISLSQNHRSLAQSVMHHPVFAIILRLHSVNLVHHLSPPSHHPSLPLSSIPDLKHNNAATNPSHHRPRSSPTHQTAHWTSNFTDFVPLSDVLF